MTTILQVSLALNGDASDIAGTTREEAEDLACGLHLSPAGYRDMAPEAAAERAYAWRQSLGALGQRC